MQYTQMIEKNKFSLVVSLPGNLLELAEGALEGGADAIKVHMNVWHRASGHTFGTYAENRTFLQELIALCGDVPVGLVPGGEDAFITPQEFEELQEMGLGYFSSYARHLPPFMMHGKNIGRMVAIDNLYNEETLSAVRHSDIDVLECSIQPGELYGTPLNYNDLLRYSHIVRATEKPCLIPTQKSIKPHEVRDLCNVGCKAVMIGAMVLGRQHTQENIRNVTRDFRREIDKL